MPREAEPNQRLTTQPKELKVLPSYTAVGTVLQISQGTWEYTYVELVNQGRLTKSQNEQISRLSRDVHQVDIMRKPLVERFITDTSAAISGHVGQKYELGKRTEALKEQLKEQLRRAIEFDKKTAGENPLAIAITRRLSTLTGHDHLRLHFAIETAATLEEFLENLQKLPPANRQQ